MMPDIQVTITEAQPINVTVTQAQPINIQLADVVQVSQGGTVGILEVQAGTDISVDNNDPKRPIVSSTVDTSGIGTNTTAISNHVTDLNNPHSVTKAQVGLSNVPNTDLTGAVNANTAKTGITTTQASDITTNNSKISYTDGAAVSANTSARHSHANKGLLDTYTQTNTDISVAVSKAHDPVDISGKQDKITLTTSGTSGASTLSAGTLNIPQYAGSYTLPTASTTVLGGVKVDGTTITIAGDTISSAGGGAVSSVNTRTGAVTGLAEQSSLTSHTSDKTNPHSVTKAQVGLSAVPNTNFTSAVNANTSKVGITPTQASDITTNNSKISYTDAAKVAGIETGAQKNVPETDPVFNASQAKNITAGDITVLGNTSGTNTGDQDLSGKADVSHTHPVGDLTATGISNAKFLRGDNTWQVPTNTAYSEITEAEITTGTASTNRVLTGRRADFIAQKGASSALNTFAAGMDTDPDMAANSDLKIPTQKAVKTALTKTGVLSYDTFTSNGTWTKPDGAKVIEIFAIGGGGGGGKGQAGAEGTSRFGGGAGGAGGAVIGQFEASALTGTVTITVGAGGAAGVTAGPWDSAGPGGATSFGTYVSAGGGGGGAAGTMILGQGNGGAAGASSLSAGNGGTALAGAGQIFSGPGTNGHIGSGGAGSSRLPNDAYNFAGVGGNSAAGSGGASPGATEDPGADGVDGSGTNGGAGGSGGGGKAKGGNGGFNGGGGGGGGAAVTPAVGGNGGSGGAGSLIVISYG